MQGDLVASSADGAAPAQEDLRVSAEWEPRSFRVDERNDGLLIRALALQATHEDRVRLLGQPDRGQGREPQGGIAGVLSTAREIILNAGDLDLLREACTARDGEIRMSPAGDFKVAFERAASAIHLTQLGYFETLPDEGWRLKPALKAKVKAALKLE